MYRLLFNLSLCLTILSSAYGASPTCSNPKLVSTTFTTQDATIVSQIAFIAEFSLKCDDPSAEGFALFAEVDGRLMTPVARIGDDKFQVSWTEETKTSGRGERTIRLFDEDGFGAVRKAQRSGGNIQSLPALATVSVHHSGAFNGPWINSEVLAAFLSILVAYVAFSTKSKLLA